MNAVKKPAGLLADSFLAESRKRWEQHDAERRAAWEALPVEEQQRRAAEQKRRKAEEEHAKRIADYARLHIPPRYYEAAWDNWTADTPKKKAAWEKVKRAWNKNLLLCGGNGTGKTHLAMCLAKDGATYRKLYEVFDEIRHGIDNDTEIINRYAGKKLLILDEIGRHKYSDFGAETFFKLIDKRYDNMLPTTLITNLEPKEFAEIYGKAALDRLKAEVVIFDWESIYMPVE